MYALTTNSLARIQNKSYTPLKMAPTGMTSELTNVRWRATEWDTAALIKEAHSILYASKTRERKPPSLMLRLLTTQTKEPSIKSRVARTLVRHENYGDT